MWFYDGRAHQSYSLLYPQNLECMCVCMCWVGWGEARLPPWHLFNLSLLFGVLEGGSFFSLRAKPLLLYEAQAWEHNPASSLPPHDCLSPQPHLPICSLTSGWSFQMTTKSLPSWRIFWDPITSSSVSQIFIWATCARREGYRQGRSLCKINISQHICSTLKMLMD